MPSAARSGRACRAKRIRKSPAGIGHSATRSLSTSSRSVSVAGRIRHDPRTRLGAHHGGPGLGERQVGELPRGLESIDICRGHPAQPRPLPRLLEKPVPPSQGRLRLMTPLLGLLGIDIHRVQAIYPISQGIPVLSFRHSPCQAGRAGPGPSLLAEVERIIDIDVILAWAVAAVGRVPSCRDELAVLVDEDGLAAEAEVGDQFLGSCPGDFEAIGIGGRVAQQALDRGVSVKTGAGTGSREGLSGRSWGWIVASARHRRPRVWRPIIPLRGHAAPLPQRDRARPGPHQRISIGSRASSSGLLP